MNIITTSTFKGHPVITGKCKEFKYNTKHLNNNFKLINTVVDRHNKVYTFRIDLHLPNDKQINEPNRIISMFLSTFTKNLSRRGLDPNYAVKMEQNSSNNPHFHIQIFVDGNKVRDHRKLVQIAEELWARQLGLSVNEAAGLIHYCDGGKNKNGMMIMRNSPHCQEQVDNCFKQMSYLAKQTDEDKVPSSTRKISYSRINRKKCRSKD